MAIVDRRGVVVSSTDPGRSNNPHPGLAIKVACVTATTVNITLAGSQTISGVAVGDGERVLVKNQTDATQNGIYNAATGNWTRAIDADASDDLAPGMLVGVYSGDFAGKVFMLTALPPVVLGTSNLVFIALAGTGDVLAANNGSDFADAAATFANLKQTATNAASGVVKVSTAVTAAAGAAEDETLRVNDAAAVYAPLISAALTGLPTAPTIASLADNSERLANSAFVQGVVSAAIAAIPLPSAGVWVGRASVFTTTGSTTAPTGSTSYNYSTDTAPTTGVRRLIDNAPLVYTALNAGAVLQFEYDADVSWPSAGDRGGDWVCALFVDSAASAIAWTQLPLLGGTSAYLAGLRGLHVRFQVSAADIAEHSYRIAITSQVSSSLGNDFSSLTRRLFTVQEASP